MDELLSILHELGKKVAPEKAKPTIGMVGYPNVSLNTQDVMNTVSASAPVICCRTG